MAGLLAKIHDDELGWCDAQRYEAKANGSVGPTPPGA